MDKKFLVILAVALVGLFGLFYFTTDKNKTNTASTSSNATVSNHSIGKNSKNVELLVYGDFQCPVCGEFYTVEKAVVEKYQNEIKFTFRHFPLDTIHPNARAAHRAAEAAGKQNKFFEMYDLIYQNQKVWSDSANPKPIFDSYAQQIGLKADQFSSDYASEIVNSTINADKAEGTAKQVQGTPTFYINGTKIDNGQLSSVEAFSKVIDEYIAKQK